ncbi:MAG: type II toxin-antitoxin system PemK/MazF family toxin [Methylocella sp.]
MPSFRHGDVVRVTFPYTDRSTRQHRPALVLSKGGIGEGNDLLWVAKITSAENRARPGDVPFGEQFRKAGLPAPSVIRSCKLATIEARRAQPLGRIAPALMREVEAALRGYLGVQ